MVGWLLYIGLGFYRVSYQVCNLNTRSTWYVNRFLEYVIRYVYPSRELCFYDTIFILGMVLVTGKRGREWFSLLEAY